MEKCQENYNVIPAGTMEYYIPLSPRNVIKEISEHD